MMRRYSIVLVVLLLAVGLVSCGKQSKNEPDQVTHSGTIGVTDAATPTPLVEEPTPTPVVDDPTPHIVWAINLGMNISDEVQAEVQTFLNEQGIECRVDFISPDIVDGGEYIQWLEDEYVHGIVPDICSACFWEYGTIDAASFVKEKFMPLNDYLNTEAGQSLWNSFSKLEWAKTSVEDTYYTVPKSTSPLFKFDTGVYLYINDKYFDYFDESFKGYYADIKRVYDTIGDEGLIISAESSGTVIEALQGGYSDFFMLGSYQVEKKSSVDLTKLTETKRFYQNMFADREKGILHLGDATLDDRTLIRVQRGRITVPLDGFVEVCLFEDFQGTSVGGAYGIYKPGKHSELALEVLGACYSDPRMASLLSWSIADEDGWKARKQYFDCCHESFVTGFIPELTGEQCQWLKDYYLDMGVLFSNQITLKAGQVILNPDYPEILEKFFSEPKDYGNLFEVLNQQLAAWMQTRTEQ